MDGVLIVVSLFLTSISGMRAALDTLRTELEATARSHAELAGAMKKELEGAVADFQARTSNARKNVSYPSLVRNHARKRH